MIKSTILFFDGDCNLCNSFVDYVLKKQLNRSCSTVILFSSLQGETAQKIMDSAHFTAEQKKYFAPTYASVVVQINDHFLIESEAIMHVLQILDKKWWENIIYSIIRNSPLFLKNFFYRQMARRRFVLFGQRSTCRIPNALEKPFFLP